ncbi:MULTISPECIES: class I SAM-dependent methyltransferase [unclassified Pseudomonas]|uniref:class I SAM-dependent methyltransferase n=1 Tax=unclassified Pseudomonas TaxID=196821 RepID=UPI000BD0156B|nr:MULTISPECIES: class I SAM-dependent methyltransferase [unclassified Pseudomonas]PVZ15480.1 methyltransferase family protein [Pseudomonas sp. URIL14HWK12:I12]PVZ24854.1 methyltransferase family protein [Pseudomonas sp. URIL14HWK12:I10]PVZ34700.1 methyltransferase family protein [Pseudomonas sp. URIL14HWK12:I11]SNZ09005.1 Methylase involved in ubiquinone/menaquinone biosynthesis [Pseudomonas sp. URIL14HWK12:I9]
MSEFFSPTYVEETRIGFHFLRTHTWQHHVLRVAINDLLRLFTDPLPERPVLLDAGCGQGKSFRYLMQAFNPSQLIGVDADPLSLSLSQQEGQAQGLALQLHGADCAALPLADASVDLVFCHQTFHHLVEQEQALAEFHRVLKPGGYLLFAESTRAYIDTWVIRWFFRHPMQVQKTAPQYLAMLRQQGFVFSEPNVSYPYLWWSRAKDFGLLERLKLRKPPAPGQREETLVNAVVRKPLAKEAPCCAP